MFQILRLACLYGVLRRHLLGIFFGMGFWWQDLISNI